MKVSKLVLALALVALPAFRALADGGGVAHTHSHTPASKEQILDVAKKMRDKLITDGKVDASWKAIEPDSAEQKEFGEKKKKKEWVVTFKDPKATDKAKGTLYMYFSLPGNYLAANFTGK